MTDQKKVNAAISSIVNRGQAANSAQPNFGQRMAAARKTPRAPSHPTKGVSSNAPPNPVNVEKGYKKTEVKVPKTKIAKPVAAKAKPGMGKPHGSHVTVNHYYGSSQPTGTDEGEY